MNEQQVRALIRQELKNSQYKVGGVPYHVHNGIDTPHISYGNVSGIPTATRSSSSLSSSIAARAYGTSSSSIPSGIDTLVALNSLDFAAGITWNATDSEFVVETAGYYLITGIATYASTKSGSEYQTEISINGNAAGSGASAKCYFQASINGGAAGPCVSTILSLNVGDYIQLYTWQNSGGNEGIYDSSNLTYLAVAMV